MSCYIWRILELEAISNPLKWPSLFYTNWTKQAQNCIYFSYFHLKLTFMQKGFLTEKSAMLILNEALSGFVSFKMMF